MWDVHTLKVKGPPSKRLCVCVGGGGINESSQNFHLELFFLPRSVCGKLWICIQAANLRGFRAFYVNFV